MNKKHCKRSWISVSCNIIYIELERNYSMGYSHGSKKLLGANSRTYEVDNPYCIFKKIKGTPEYWKTRKMELLSRLDNFGPFQFFFTLSCADLRWEENFATLMKDLELKLTYETDCLTDEIRTMITVGEETISLEDYLVDRRFCNDTRHTRIKKMS